MNINEVLIVKYEDLKNQCALNIISSIQNTSGIKDFEQLDLLHTLILRWLKKYKNTEFTSIDDAYNILKTEFLGEKNHYGKMKKPDQMIFVEFDDFKLDIIDDVESF